MAVGLEAIIELPDPVGEVLDRADDRERRRARAGAGPDRRRRDRLRGAPERDDRRRRALPEERQRRRPARLELRRRLERRARRDLRARRSRRPGCPHGSIELIAGGGREELGELARQAGLRRPDHPARRRGPEGRAQGGRRGAGALRGRRQLPRLRARRRRPRDGAADRVQRQGPAARASATRPRRCSSTREIAARVPAGGAAPSCSEAGVELVGDEPHASAGRRGRRSASRPRSTGRPSTTR